MTNWSEIRDKITAKTGAQVRSTTEAGMEQLRTLKVPGEAIAFFREANPITEIEIGKVRLLPIATVVEENTNYVPGAYIQPHGYVVFSTTLYGDTYCFDLNSANSSTTAPIVLLSHEMIGEDTTKEEVGRLAKKIAPVR